jgi:1,4-alpha-glucan branching enzyme
MISFRVWVPNAKQVRVKIGVADAGDSWSPIVRDLPAVVSVEVQTLS